MCCQLQPPHADACRQRGVMRWGDGSRTARISTSVRAPAAAAPTGLRSRIRRTRTRSPGMPPWASSLSSPRRATAAPERSIPLRVTTSSSAMATDFESTPACATSLTQVSRVRFPDGRGPDTHGAARPQVVAAHGRRPGTGRAPPATCPTPCWWWTTILTCVARTRRTSPPWATRSIAPRACARAEHGSRALPTTP